MNISYCLQECSQFSDDAESHESCRAIIIINKNIYINIIINNNNIYHE